MDERVMTGRLKKSKLPYQISDTKLWGGNIVLKAISDSRRETNGNFQKTTFPYDLDSFLQPVIPTRKDRRSRFASRRQMKKRVKLSFE